MLMFKRILSFRRLQLSGLLSSNIVPRFVLNNSYCSFRRFYNSHNISASKLCDNSAIENNETHKKTTLELAVTKDQTNMRLDRFLKMMKPPSATMSHRWLCMSLRKKRIKILCAQSSIKPKFIKNPAFRVSEGQIIRIPSNLFKHSRKLHRNRKRGNTLSKKHSNTHEFKVLEELLKRSIIFSNEHMLAINKPPGLAVQDGTGLTTHLGKMLHLFQSPGDDMLRIVHRLDKDCSGVLVLARNRRAAVRISDIFQKKHEISNATEITTRKIVDELEKQCIELDIKAKEYIAKGKIFNSEKSMKKWKEKKKKVGISKKKVTSK